MAVVLLAATRTTPGSSLYIFAEKHYSYTYAIGDSPRRLLGVE